MSAALRPVANGHPSRALAVARGAALAGAIGTGAAPPLANAGVLVMLVAFALLPDGLARLRRVLREPLGRGWLVFVATVLLAFVVGAVLNGAAAAAHGLYGWRHLLLIPVGLALFDTPRARLRFALGFVAFALVGGIAATVMWKLGLAYREGQAPGILLRNSVTQALVFAVGAFFALLLASTRQVAVPWQRALLGAAGLGLLALLLFLQQGRSGQVAFAVMVVVAALLLLRGRTRVVALAAAVLLGVAAYGASGTMQARFAMAVTEMRNAATLPVYTSMGMRMVMWETTVELIGERPVLGYGLGGMVPAYAARTAIRQPGVQPDFERGWKAITTGDPHNQYLFLWVEAGLPGLLGFAALLLGALRQPAPVPWRATGVALLAAWCVTSLFSSHFQTFNEGTLIALLLGVFLARDT